MSKFNLFVSVYSVIMLALFITFCFLMSNINPPRIKQDPEQSRRYGPDDLIYSDEFLPNDNVGYGLEKVDDDYDSIDIFPRKGYENRRNLPTLYIDKNFKTNCTRKEANKMATRSMKHIKGLRRSIKENHQDNTIPRSVHLKIKDLGGRPRIEIKVVPEISKNKKIRKYRSSANITNNTLTFYIHNDMPIYDYDNISKEVIVVIENNEKFVLDFARDSISLYDGNINDYINNKDTILNDINITETNNIRHDLFNTSIERNITKKFIMNKAESNPTYFENTTQSMNKSGKVDVKNMAVSLNSVTVFDTKSNTEFINNSYNCNTTTESSEASDTKTDETQHLASVPVNTLVGLLIPEATATLPFNYHFIN